ncbi:MULTISPECIES: hypothetical protein [Halorussus]|uniref:hypothetical protein n=1 Tax=Halorussus TaxID=1070314 RepID=UPI00209FE845|nr:hypothetical protein [Halorussus vallis]USZ74458.1 hypothetical protein NGM07_13505 [Halorussus vallis]
MRLGPFRRLTERLRSDAEGTYVCTLCGARFDDGRVVCPKCRGFVVSADDD